MAEKDDDESEDFAAMLEESLQPRMFRNGEAVEGKIVAFGADVAFVDVGGKGEATIDLEELKGEDGALLVEVGATIKAIVVATTGGIKLSYHLARHAATREALVDAYESGLPVEGRVESAIKGGLEIRFSGQRAFCPISQIDTRYTEDPEVHVGKTYRFRVIECKDGGKNVVVSRRALLEEEDEARAEEVRKLVVEGAVLPGRVVSVRDYGAFVDLGGGVQGLLHVSEMSWSRVADPFVVVQPDDEIEVKVLKVDEERGKISLGLKQLQADPWSSVERTYQPGHVVRGRVTRLADFGAFVEILPGIEALAHVSTFPPTGRTDGWRDAVSPGAEVAVEILSVEGDKKRMGVAIVDEGSSRARGAGRALEIVPGARLVGKVEKHEGYGVFVFLQPGKIGLVPLAETGVERDGDLRRTFPVGSDIEVVVLDVDAESHRIRLSHKAVGEARERGEARDYAERQEQEQDRKGGFGSFADSLRAAIERPKQ
jgi:small subunit ribosomal protein S1